MGRKNSAGNSVGLVLIAAFLLPLALCARRPSPQIADPAASTARTSTLPAALPETPIESGLYVRSLALNLRASPNGRVIGKLAQGAAVDVHLRQDGWSRISADGEPERWVSSANLCSGINCYEPKISPAPRMSSQPAKVSQGARRSSYDYSDNCPCSTSRNCFGPRGGRYCITSGGNKRYR